MTGGQQVAQGPGLATPPSVLEGLVTAFGDKIGETGYDIAASRCCSEMEKTQARTRGSSLLYGEMLPDGVSKALHPFRLGQPLLKEGAESMVMELGMGSGKVAMQIFLQCPTVRHLLGIELVKSRYEIAEDALKRLVSALPKTYRLSASSPGQHICIEEVQTKRRLECRCADFFSLGLDLTERSDVIFFAVNIPCKLFPELCSRFAKAKEGCRLFTYHRLDTIWWTDVPCPFRQVEVNVPETDTFATSWSPQGYRFYVYVCDRSCPPSVKNDPRNETFSEWQAMWDEANQGYFFHNQESEVSQWDLPVQVGCWQAQWCQEQNAWFFWHPASGHSQWDPPKCMETLGWSWGSPPPK
eukprot:TRINITY_DN4332_c0_g4_i1.p1 TRINITY_DN4332_c0_g4~~TRINITY_DN4332_c0_g4_i1.p1  ORF type:complete len:366 (+),score=46.47 TRINITY_DN4332_c0_g4_i1:36-1100(+)